MQEFAKVGQKLACCLLLAACSPRAQPEATTQQQPPPKVADANKQAPVDDEAHRVVFADRIAYSYVLLLGPTTEKSVTAPTKQELRELVLEAFPGREHDEEVQLLLGLIEAKQTTEGGPTLEVPASEVKPDDGSSQNPGSATGEPPTQREQAIDVAAQAAAEGELADGEIDADAQETLRRKRRMTDLLGLDVEVHPLVPTNPDEPALVDMEILREPILSRDLNPEQRASLANRQWVMVVRARYRNQHGVRGLRLLQTIVRVLAQKYDALVHDPDTRETVTRETFYRTRLQTRLGNVADQIPVVPFQDNAHTINGKPAVRLATRGMRRFGSVDIELAGLPPDPEVLQQATHFVYGVAFNLIKLGVYDRSGYAVEMPDAIHVHYKDCAQAYASRDVKLPRCADCPEEVRIHLVERKAEAQDAQGHVVANIVAPRHLSDAAGYDHPAWVSQALARVLGL